MRSLLLLFVFLIASIVTSNTAIAQSSSKIVWKGDVFRKPNAGAQLMKTIGGMSVTLANPIRRTWLKGKVVNFEPETVFAVFKNMKLRGRSNYVLALSETGIWVFAPLKALTRKEDVEQNAEKTKFQSVNQIVLMRNKGFFLDPVDACGGEQTLERSKGVSVEANTTLGIFGFSLGGELSQVSVQTVDKGQELYVWTFGTQRTADYIEIFNYQACGRTVDRGQHLYAIKVNGSDRQVINLSEANAVGFPFDRDSNRAIIKCRKHRDAYYQFLNDRLDLDEIWLPIVAAMTARWKKGYVQFETC